MGPDSVKMSGAQLGYKSAQMGPNDKFSPGRSNNCPGQGLVSCPGSDPSRPGVKVAGREGQGSISPDGSPNAQMPRPGESMLWLGVGGTA